MTSNKERGNKIMPNLKFTNIFPEYTNLHHWDYNKTPEYILYSYLILDDKTISRLEKVRMLLTAPETFYAKDILKDASKGGIINGLNRNGLIVETGKKIKYYIDDPYGKTAIIGYSKEWKLAMPRDRMILAYNRIRNEILKII
jgi:hypothetical protein